MSVLNDAVSSSDDGTTYDFRCPGIAGSQCGDPNTGVGFTSPGWATKKAALARGQEHFNEHKHPGEAQHCMSSLEDFRAKHGLVPAADGRTTIRLEDLP